MTKQVNIVMIGTGNVAFHIAQSVQSKKNLRIVQVFNHRHSRAALLMSKVFNTTLEADYRKIVPTADLYIVAVKDDAIADVVSNLKPLKIKGTVVHTSGSVDIAVLNGVSPSYGVYYPLQTFYKNALIDWLNTPILIEANSKATLSILKRVGKAISDNVVHVSSVQRLQIHMAAVFACNFTNALCVTAYEIIERSVGKAKTKLLYPIIKHSFQKLESVHPRKAQTGPAMRNDKGVMKKHIALLKNERDLILIYRKLSELIQSQQS